jgi:hypothetical protein
MRTDADVYYASSRGVLDVLIGVFLAPVMFLVNLVVTYVFVDWSCRSAGPLPIHLMNLGCLLLAIYGAVKSYRNWSAAGREWPHQMGGVIGRTRFLGLIGTFFSAYFAIAIIAQGIPALLIGPCRS